MNENSATIESQTTPSPQTEIAAAPTQRSKPSLRPDRRLLDPEEMTPEERWDEVIELLTIMALPTNGTTPPTAKDGLDVENHHAL